MSRAHKTEAGSLIPKEAMCLIRLADDQQCLLGRQRKLKESLESLSEEGLPILPIYLSKLEEIQGKIQEMRSLIQKTWDNVHRILTKDTWLILLAELEDKTKGEAGSIITASMKDVHKERFYHTVRSDGELRGDDLHLVQRFEQHIGYSIAFAKTHWLGEETDDVSPFLDLFERYLDGYHDQLASTVQWLRHTVFPMRLHPSLHKRYAQTMVRRLDIGEKEACLLTKKDIQKRATEEIEELLQQQQQKKSS